MNNIRAFDKVIITNPLGILGQKGGFDFNGEWSVVSSHEELIVLSRGARILRVKPDAVEVTQSSATLVDEDDSIDCEDLCDGEV